MTQTILQIIPNMGAGGAEQAVVDVAAALVARGDRALIVSQGGARVAELEKAGAEHIVKNVASKNPVQIIKNAFWLAQFAREKGVSLFHVRSRAPAWSVRIAANMTGLPVVTTFHAAYKFKGAVKKYYNRIMTRADRIIAISDFIGKHIVDAYEVDPSRIRVIPRGIDFDRFAHDKVTDARQQALRTAWALPADARVILLPARLSPIKGHELFLEALAYLALGDAPSWVAVILGDDQGRKSYRAKLETLISEKNLKEKVRLVAHCADMPAAYSLASLVMAPSLIPEGFGRVPVEAMAMGVPVIASNLGGLGETINDGQTGWLLPPAHSKAWAKAMALALSLPEEKRQAMQAEALRQVQTRFDKQQMIQDTLAVYDEVLS